jgi:hypothetical protein
MEFRLTGMPQMMDDNPGVTKIMDTPTKDVSFKCPSCGDMLTVETKGTSDNEHAAMQNGNKPQSKQNAANMPMDKLRNKVVGSSTPGMFQPPPAAPNLNTY